MLSCKTFGCKGSTLLMSLNYCRLWSGSDWGGNWGGKKMFRIILVSTFFRMIYIFKSSSKRPWDMLISETKDMVNIVQRHVQGLYWIRVFCGILNLRSLYFTGVFLIQSWYMLHAWTTNYLANWMRSLSLVSITISLSSSDI